MDISPTELNLKDMIWQVFSSAQPTGLRSTLVSLCGCNLLVSIQSTTTTCNHVLLVICHNVYIELVLSQHQSTTGLNRRRLILSGDSKQLTVSCQHDILASGPLSVTNTVITMLVSVVLLPAIEQWLDWDALWDGQVKSESTHWLQICIPLHCTRGCWVTVLNCVLDLLVFKHYF